MHEVHLAVCVCMRVQLPQCLDVIFHILTSPGGAKQHVEGNMRDWVFFTYCSSQTPTQEHNEQGQRRARAQAHDTKAGRHGLVAKINNLRSKPRRGKTRKEGLPSRTDNRLKKIIVRGNRFPPRVKLPHKQALPSMTGTPRRRTLHLTT